MNLKCKIFGHRNLKIELFTIPKGTPDPYFNIPNYRAEYAITYDGAEVVCENCGESLKRVSKERIEVNK